MPRVPKKSKSVKKKFGPGLEKKMLGPQVKEKGGPKKRKKMETTRFDSRVVQNLRITGSLDNNGKQTVVKRCWATFKVSENTSVTPQAPTNGVRGSFTPMRIYDYETKKAFTPPPNATIVAVSVLGKTEADHEKLTKFRTSIGTATGSNGIAIGVMRAPNPDVDTVASRDCTTSVVAAMAAGAATLQALNTRDLNSKDVYTAANDVCNPYDYYYKYLSPVTTPVLYQANKNIGVCQEFIDRTLVEYTGAIRIPWGAPPATANNGKNINAVVSANPGLSLFITSQNPATGASIPQAQQISLVATADITFDVLVELEFDENTDLLADNSVAFSNLDLQGQTV